MGNVFPDHNRGFFVICGKNLGRWTECLNPCLFYCLDDGGKTWKLNAADIQGFAQNPSENPSGRVPTPRLSGQSPLTLG